MSSINIQKIGITRLNTDAIVNAANKTLAEGGGVCGAIFREAGSASLTQACNAIGHCDTGSAVITPGFDLPAKYIIHAVGPIWHGGDNNEPKLLYSAYKQSLIVAKDNNCHSIGFPLISAGIFGYPKDKAWRKALQACQDFLKANPDYDIDIIFAVLDDEMMEMGTRVMMDLNIETSTAEVNDIDPGLDQKCQLFCDKYFVLLKLLHEDETIRDWCKSFDVYAGQNEHGILGNVIYGDFMHQAYDDGIVINDYSEVIESGELEPDLVSKPTAEWVNTLSKRQIIACIAKHFRADHFSEGSLLNYSVAEGHLLVLMKGYLDKCRRCN